MSGLLEAVKAAVAGQYDIIREVGRGGMAIVFQARDLKHDRTVALKMLRPELAVTLASDRFLREIRIAAGLSHPHILALYDSGIADERLYYVTPFVEGESLSELIQRTGPLTVERAVAIARDVASALSYAHERGIIHRDIKPGNVLVTAKDAVVADFGIARALAQVGDDRLTESGLALGTLTYMAPEQAAGQVDARSDIYSLGCTLYEMLAGRPPFGGGGVMLMAQHARATFTPIRSIRGDVSPKLAAVVDRALAKDPQDRFATADDFLEALGEVSAAQLIVAQTPSPRVRFSRRARLLTGLVAVAAAVGSIIFIRSKESSPNTPQTPTIAVFPFHVRGALDSSIVSPEALVDLIYARLPGDGGPRAIHPRAVMQAWRSRRFSADRPPPIDEMRKTARSLGASQMLVGEGVGTPNRVELSGTVYSVNTGEVVSQLHAAGSADSVLSLIDGLAAELLIKQAGEGRRRLADLLTEQLPALRSYLSGLGKYRRGRYVDAISDFNHALELDSSFALAAIELASAETMAGAVDGEDARALDAAWRSRRRLSTRDSVYLSMHLGPRYPLVSGMAEQLRAWDGFLTRGREGAPLVPERWEAWYFFGDLLFHAGPYVGNTSAHALARNAFRQALIVDSALAPAVEHLIELAAAARDSSDVHALARLYFAVDSSGDNAEYVRWRLATLSHNETDRVAIRARFPRMATSALNRIVGSAQLEAIGLDDAIAASAEVRRRARTELDLYVAALMQRELALNRGRPNEALSKQLDTPKRSRNPVEPLFRVIAASFWGGDTSDASKAVALREAALASALARHDSTWAVPMDECTVGLWHASHDHTRDAQRSIGLLAAYRSPLDSIRTAYIAICRAILEARVAAASALPGRDRAQAAVTYLDSLMQSGPETNSYIKFAGNWTAAELLEARGDLRGALAAVRRRPYQADSHGVVGLSALLRREGRLAAAVGDTAAAIDAYERYLRLRTAPEASVVPQVDSVRNALAVLKRAKTQD